MIERRAMERIEINQLAMLHLDGVCGVYPCMVMNFHNRAARLRCSTFHLTCHSMVFKTTKHCHVVWRDGNTCGVEFVDRSDARTLC